MYNVEGRGSELGLTLLLKLAWSSPEPVLSQHDKWDSRGHWGSFFSSEEEWPPAAANAASVKVFVSESFCEKIWASTVNAIEGPLGKFHLIHGGDENPATAFPITSLALMETDYYGDLCVWLVADHKRLQPQRAFA